MDIGLQNRDEYIYLFTLFYIAKTKVQPNKYYKNMSQLIKSDTNKKKLQIFTNAKKNVNVFSGEKDKTKAN